MALSATKLWILDKNFKTELNLVSFVFNLPFYGMKWFKLRDEIESIVLGEIIQCKHSNNSLQSHSEWHFSDKPNAIGNPIQIKSLKVSLKIRNSKYIKNILSYKCVASWIWRKQLCRWMNKSHKVINIDRHSLFENLFFLDIEANYCFHLMWFILDYSNICLS